MTKHGKWKSKEWNSWDHMKRRCLNPNDPKFPDYGGRGIEVCERWLKFENFYEDMGDAPSSKHSLERKDNDGNYELSNCKWASPVEQSNNRRKREKKGLSSGRVWGGGHRRTGENNGKAKLSHQDVVYIKTIGFEKSAPQLARMFNVDISTIYKARKRKA